MTLNEVIDALKQGLSNVNSRGHGRDPKHVENPFHDTIESHGVFKYLYSYVLESTGLPIIEHVYRYDTGYGDTYSVRVQDYKSCRSTKTHYFRYELTGPTRVDYKCSDYFYRNADGIYCNADDIDNLKYLLDSHAYIAQN